MGEVIIHAEDRDQGTVYRLEVHNPSRLNVLDTLVTDGLMAACRSVNDHRMARAVVISGSEEGCAWVGGADIREMVDLDHTNARSFITKLHTVFAALRALPVPVVAAIDGFCLGAGLELAASCDLRVATADSQFGMPEVRVGIPSVVEAALIPKLIGAGRARDLVLTGRLISAATAQQWGLVECVADRRALGERVEAHLSSILAAAPGAVAAQKRLCNDWEQLDYAHAIEASMDAFAAAYDGDEPKTYMSRFLHRKRSSAPSGRTS